jgi:branched-chain amino acid transport system substrate-binding protein
MKDRSHGSAAGRLSSRRVVGVALVATLLVGGASIPWSGAAPVRRPAQKATDTPVKVGLISAGDACDGCAAPFEEPAAEAAVEWLNAKRNGLAGHPMELVTCITDNEPGKAADCANEMVREGVVAVVEGSSGTIGTSWAIIHEAGIPFINHSTTESAILEDEQSTFILYDPLAQTVTLPIETAKAQKTKKISVIVVNYPAATEIYESAADIFDDADIDLDVVPVDFGVADMSTQAQQVIRDNPDGVVSIVGHDAFCIPALNGLNAFGFQGTITTISHCITDAMRQAVQPEVIEGMAFGSEAPVGATKLDKSMREYRRALKKYAPEAVDPDDLLAVTVFQSFGALSLGTKTLQGEVTPASVITAMKGMDNEVLPAAGGRLFRCNGKASDFAPSICSASTMASRLDSSGEPTKYTLENNEPIPD